MPATDPARHQALHTIFVSYHSWLLASLRRRLRHRGDAEDLTSETFLQVVDSPVDVQRIEEPRAYLTTIA